MRSIIFRLSCGCENTYAHDPRDMFLLLHYGRIRQYRIVRDIQESHEPLRCLAIHPDRIVAKYHNV